MKTRMIGASGLASSAIGLGCNRLFDPNNPAMVEAVLGALELGINHFDSADVYGQGQSESFLGTVLKGRRDKAIIVSKFGITGPTGANGHPQYMKQVFDASLKRLATDSIDLYYFHRLDPGVPIEETAGAMAELVKAGKVRAIGLSNTNAESIRRAHKVHPLAAVQMEYSLMERSAEKDVLPLCKELGITFVAYGPLTYAFLAGRIKKHEDLPPGDRFRRNQSRFTDDNIRHNVGMLEALDEVSAQMGATRAKIALAWCLQRPWDVLPIPGSTRIEHVRENVAAAELELTKEQVARLDEAFAIDRPRGNAASAPAR